MMNVTTTFMSFLFPFTSAIPVTISKDDSSTPRPLRRHQDTRIPLSGVDSDSPVIPSPPTRKGSWLSRPPPNERRQSCRRVNSRRRDWSDELEESEFHLPFPVASHDHERGGVPMGRMVSFREDVRVRPRIDTLFVEQGLMIDVDSE